MPAIRTTKKKPAQAPKKKIYRNQIERLQYLQEHPYAGRIDANGGWVVCLACTSPCEKYPCSLQLDIRAKSRWDLTSWKRHCKRHHRAEHARWESGEEIPKVEQKWSDGDFERFMVEVVPGIDSRIKEKGQPVGVVKVESSSIPQIVEETHEQATKKSRRKVKVVKVKQPPIPMKVEETQTTLRTSKKKARVVKVEPSPIPVKLLVEDKSLLNLLAEAALQRKASESL